MTMGRGERHAGSVVALVVGAAIASVLSACSGSPDTGASHSSKTSGPAGTAAQPGGSVAGWFADKPVVEPATDERDDTQLGPDRPGPTLGPEAPVRPVAAPVKGGGSAPANGKPAKAVDVCALIPLTEWASWSGAAQASDSSDDPGSECLYVEPDDRARMVLRVTSSSPRTLDDATKVSAQRIATLGSPGYWLPGTPTTYGSTLVVELADFDVVIELYNRNPAHDSGAVRAAAERWASQAIGALS